MHQFYNLTQKVKSLLFILVFLVLPAGLLAETSNGYGVAVRLTSSDLQKVNPGGTAYFSVVVSNQQPQGENFVGKILLPENCPISVPDELNFYLNISAAQEQEIALYIPQNSSTGTYSITYFVEGRNNSVLRDQVTFNVEVLPGKGR